MEKLFTQLKNVIDKQIQLLDLIKCVEKSKNEILSKGSLMDFSEINENLESLISENNKLEEEREKISNKIFEKLKITDEHHKTLKYIINNIENDKLKNEFLEKKKILHETVEDIKYISQINRELIDTVLQVIDLSLSQDSLSNKDIDYTDSIDSSKDKSLLINKMI